MKNLPMLFATTSALDPPGRDNFLDSDNKEVVALNSLLWSKLFFSMNSIVICPTRLVHQQCWMILLLFECRIMHWNLCSPPFPLRFYTFSDSSLDRIIKPGHMRPVNHGSSLQRSVRFKEERKG